MELILDLVYEILLRLPVKSLIRFRCVCKQWYSLISDPCFQQGHYHRRSEQDHLILKTRLEFEESSTETDTNTTLHLSTYNTQGILIHKISRTGSYPPCWYYTVQSCQGLVCVIPIKDNYRHRLLLCNPSTEEIIALPPAQESHKSVIGFGYAASTKEFKVVIFYCHRKSNGDDEFLCQIFTLGTSEWRESTSPPEHGYFFNSNVPFINGALHLLRDLEYDYIDGSMDDGIDVFNIESEEYTKIPLPKYYRTAAASSINDLYLQELGGSLYLGFNFKTRMELWCLKEYDAREWVKEYTIDLDSMGSVLWAGLLTVMRDGRMLLNILKDDECCMSLYYYNSGDKSFKKIIEEYEDGDATLYVESLLSLGSRV